MYTHTHTEECISHVEVVRPPCSRRDSATVMGIHLVPTIWCTCICYVRCDGIHGTAGKARSVYDRWRADSTYRCSTAIKTHEQNPDRGYSGYPHARGHVDSICCMTRPRRPYMQRQDSLTPMGCGRCLWERQRNHDGIAGTSPRLRL